jgi:Stress-induced bacterial acidophilic repeat motif
MDVVIVKDERFDRITIRRGDGTGAESRFPKKGPLPHDAIHYVVEDVLHLKNAFWGMIASGLHPEEVQEIAKQGGHASASRADVPQAHIVELIQAERLVECFEANSWGAPSPPETLRDVARVACAASHVPLPDVSDAVIHQIAARISDLQREWVSAPVGHRFAFHWSAR